MRTFNFQLRFWVRGLAGLPPKTAVYSKISLKDIEREVLKAVNVKARWEDMGRQEREE